MLLSHVCFIGVTIDLAMDGVHTNRNLLMMPLQTCRRYEAVGGNCKPSYNIQ